MSTDATDIRCAECGRDITHATSIYLVSGRYVCDICYVRLTAPRDCKHGQLARSCEICELLSERDALAAEVERLREAVINKHEIRFVDATPNDELPVRILRAYLDRTVWSDNTLGVEPSNPLCIELNRLQVERNRIIEQAIAALAQSQPGGDHE